MITTLVAFITVPIVVVVLIIAIWLKNRKIISADEALVVCGTQTKHINPNTGESRIINGRVISRGGAVFIKPFMEKPMFVDLKVIQIPLEVEDLPSKNFVKVDVKALAIIKVRDDEDAIRTASTRFGDFRKPGVKEEVKDALHEIMQGHLRSTIATLTPEELNSEREKFNQQVQDASGDRLAELGMQIVDFTIKTVKDKEGYLETLKADKVAVKFKQILIDESNAKAETEKAVVENNKKRITYETEQKVLEEKKRGEAETAVIKANETIEKANKEREIEIKKKEIALIDQENKRKIFEFELDKEKQVIEAKAKAEASKLTAEAITTQAKAEASAIEMKGLAEAKFKKALAEAFENLDKKSQALFILEKAPEIIKSILKDDSLSKIFGEVAKPISSIESVKVYDFGGSANGNNPIQKFSDITPSILINLVAKMKELGFDNLIEKLGVDSTILEGDNKKNKADGE